MKEHDSRLEIRLPKTLKSDFKKVCEELGVDYSEEVRKLLKGFRARHEKLLK